MKLVEPDQRQAMGTKGMESVVDRDFRRSLLVGSIVQLFKIKLHLRIKASMGQVRMR